MLNSPKSHDFRGNLAQPYSRRENTFYQHDRCSKPDFTRSGKNDTNPLGVEVCAALRPNTDRRPGRENVRGCRSFMVLAGLGMLLLAGGCQAAGKGTATAGNGPSPLFGQKFAPSQSEPP